MSVQTLTALPSREDRAAAHERRALLTGPVVPAGRHLAVRAHVGTWHCHCGAWGSVERVSAEDARQAASAEHAEHAAR